ncbi:hypothetical protein P3X46_015319 [Hevea brasiliensis]|uniref:Bromo domain-containing protein n=1 Tax=Hevea brasiliensis TaxID=3981 RepID=A0ABQ9LZN0_HEVBR|nr:hypothetical protein P3X46_015319 [Hevea brasiliensis]
MKTSSTMTPQCAHSPLPVLRLMPGASATGAGSGGGGGSSARKTKLKTENSTVKIEKSDGGPTGTGAVGSTTGSSSVKIFTENLQTSGAYSAREESLKREEAGRLKFLCLANDGIDEHMQHALDVDGLTHFLTYADNNAVDCDGGILMECRIDPKLPYTDLSTMIRRQRQAIDEKIRELSNCHIVYTGFDFQKSMHDHVDAWPYKEPVDARDDPDYYDIIKDPMGETSN